MNDPIGDFIIRLKNANLVGKESVSLPSSNMKLAISSLLKSRGYIGEVAEKSRGKARILNIDLLYREDGKPKIEGVKRVSKPSRRLYEKSQKIRKFRRGYGLSVFSTSKGIKSDMEAKKEKLGGEFLFSIW